MAKEKANTSTEEKIKLAAKKVFMQKGYAASRTRDIAEAAGINLALLNYYFRSKEKLFDIIMLENLQQFIEGIREILNSTQTSIEQKMEAISSNYITLLTQQPDLPLFILHELRTHPKAIISKIDKNKFFAKSYFMQQLKDAIKEGKIAPLQPLHLLMNLIGLTVFPFIANPILCHIGGLKQQEFNVLMEERKKLIPIWMKAIMQKK